tara:strand:- start:1182 stop:1505 length:324 start_codon:yes stop_codon:yes gene_type:complete
LPTASPTSFLACGTRLTSPEPQEPADVLSGGRPILRVASGDCPEEYLALKVPFMNRGARFRDSDDDIRRMSDEPPEFRDLFGSPSGNMDIETTWRRLAYEVLPHFDD